LGGSLTGNTTVAQGTNSLSFTGSGVTNLSSTGGTIVNNLIANYSAFSDANHTIGSSETLVQLKGAITANRTLTFPDANLYTGRVLVIQNNTTNSNFNWLVSGSGTGAAITGPDGNTLAQLNYNTSYVFVSYTQGWSVVSQATINNTLQGKGDLTAQTAAVGTVTSFAVPGSGSYNSFRIGGYITVTAISLDVIQLQVSWTDETSTSRTQSFFVQGSTTGISATGASAYSPMDIRVKQGTTITVATVLTTGTGSITYDVGASISQLY
jgi:hypothetical protein